MSKYKLKTILFILVLFLISSCAKQEQEFGDIQIVEAVGENWVSPTSHNDPDACWSDEGNAYDGNTGTSATCDFDDKILELILDAPIECDKVQFWFSSQTGNWIVEVAVFYDGQYHAIYDENGVEGEYVEVEIGSTETVSKARIEGNTLPGNRQQLVHEFQFNEIVTVTEGFISNIPILKQMDVI